MEHKISRKNPVPTIVFTNTDPHWKQRYGCFWDASSECVHVTRVTARKLTRIHSPALEEDLEDRLCYNFCFIYSVLIPTWKKLKMMRLIKLHWCIEKHSTVCKVSAQLRARFNCLFRIWRAVTQAKVMKTIEPKCLIVLS
jgi:hypothetical protein